MLSSAAPESGEKTSRRKPLTQLLTHTETRPGWRTRRCGGAFSFFDESEESFADVVVERESGSQLESQAKKKRMKPALQQQQQACLPGRRPLLLPIAAAPCRRPTPRRYQCSAEVPRAGEGENEDEKPSTSSTSSSSQSPPLPPRPPPPDPEKRWRRLWGGNPHGVYRVPGVSDWFARAPQVRVRSRTDRQVRGKEAGMKESEKKKKKKKNVIGKAICFFLDSSKARRSRRFDPIEAA
mgnify:CR=1 FL=1